MVEYDWQEMTYRPYCQICAWVGESTADNYAATRQLEIHLTSDEHRDLNP